jgi:hypothetical protein
LEHLPHVYRRAAAVGCAAAACCVSGWDSFCCCRWSGAVGPSPGEAVVVVVLVVVAVVAAVSVSDRARFSVGSPLGWSSTSTAEDARTRASMLSDDTGSSRNDAEPILREQFPPGLTTTLLQPNVGARVRVWGASGGKLEICNCRCCGAGRASLLKLKRERIFDLQSSRESDRTPGHR